MDILILKKGRKLFEAAKNPTVRLAEGKNPRGDRVWTPFEWRRWLIDNGERLLVIAEQSESLAICYVAAEDELDKIKKDKQRLILDALSSEGQWIEEVGKLNKEIKELKAKLNE